MLYFLTHDDKFLKRFLSPFLIVLETFYRLSVIASRTKDQDQPEEVEQLKFIIFPKGYFFQFV